MPRAAAARPAAASAASPARGARWRASAAATAVRSLMRAGSDSRRRSRRRSPRRVRRDREPAEQRLQIGWRIGLHIDREHRCADDMKRTRQAWSACRPKLAAARCRRGSAIRPRTEPRYTGSPTSGQPRSARWTRSWCVRPVTRRHSSRLTPCAGAARAGQRAIVGHRRRAVARSPSPVAGRAGCGPARASMRPRAGAGRPHTRARYSLTIGARCSAACTSRDLATTTRPDVPLSRRCTRCGCQRRHRTRAACPMSAFSSVPDAWRNDGWTI